MYVIRTLSAIILSKINDLAQMVHVSEILHHFPNLPTHLRSVYDPTGSILVYREVPHVLRAKYQPNQPSDSGRKVV